MKQKPIHAGWILFWLLVFWPIAVIIIIVNHNRTKD